VTAGIEIERKFLVDELPADLDSRPSAKIDQGYIAIGEDGTEVRLRRSDSEHVLTVKQGGGRSRREEEIELDAETFERLWPLTEGRRIVKTRYAIRADSGLTIELDVYAGALEGLVTAEVEFPSEEAADGFDPPGWFGREVTDDPGYKNQTLAMRGTPSAGETRG
jgi:CYTH domain-containing protein